MQRFFKFFSRNTLFRLSAGRIALLYAAFATAWILLSGYLVITTVTDQTLARGLEIGKGLLFVVITSGLLFLLLRTWHSTMANGEADNPIAQTGISARTRGVKALAASLFILVPLLGWLVTEIQRPHIEHNAYANLQAIAELKASQIENWLGERSADGKTLMESTGFIDRVVQLRSTGSVIERDYVHRRLQALADAYGYESVELLDPSGGLILSSAPHENMQQHNPTLLARSLKTGEIQFNGGAHDASGRLHLDFVVPLRSATHSPVAIAILHMSPDRFLFPYIQHWPGLSASGETVLVRPDHDKALFLTPLRPKADNSNDFRLELSDHSLPAAVAIKRASPGIVSGKDYRGTPVLAAHRPIKGTDWQIVVKQDKAEAFAALKPLVFWVSLVEFFAILAVLAVLVLLRRKQMQLARLALQLESDQLFKLFYELPFLGMAISSVEDNRFLHCNDRLCEILGYDRSELSATTWTDVSHPDDIEEEKLAYNRVLRGEADSYQIEKRVIRKDGSIAHTQVNARSVRKPDGTIAYFAATLQDVTEQKQTAQKLKESERSYRTLADSAPALIWTSGSDKFCNYFNKVWLEFTGRPLEKELGNGWLEGVHPDDYSCCLEIFSTAFELRESFSMDFRLRRHDGEYRWIQNVGSPRYGDNGVFLGYIGYCLDITDRVLAQKLLQDSETRLRSMVRNLPMVLCTIDQNGIFTSSEGRALEKLGLKPGEAVGHSAYELYRDYPQVLDCIRRAIGGEFVHKETQVGNLWYDSAYQPFTPLGQYAGAMVASIDITARKAVEGEQQSRLKRLECISRITSYPAHSTQDLLDFALHEVLQFSGSRIGYIYFYNEATQEFKLNSWSREAMAECSVVEPQTTYSLENTGFWGEAVRQRKPIINNDFEADHPHKKGTPAGHVFMRRFMTIPVMLGERIVAVVGVANKFRDYEQADAEQLELLMDAVWRVAEQRQSEDEVQRISGLLDVAQTMAHVGGWEVNAKDRSRRWTDEVYRILDIDPASVTLAPETAISFYTPECRPIIADALHNALEHGTGFDIELEVITPNGELRHVRSRGEAQREDGKITKVIGAIQDITAYKNIENELLQHQEHLEELVAQRTHELEQARLSAEQATKAKSAFLANMSHEIRTPITAVLGMAHLAQRTRLTAKQQDYLDKIMISANMLLGVINDILDFSKIEAGRLEMSQSEFLLGDVLDKVIAVTGMKAADKQLEFLASIAPNTPMSLVGDASRLAQILVNLCSNAVKFTDEGEILLSISRTSWKPDDSLELLFTVRDTGIGMTQDEITELFQPFNQVDASDTRRFGGTGLGLAICKQLVELMGGRIWARSEPAQGSEFSFTLPFGIGPGYTNPKSTLFADLYDLNALVVDRNATSRDILCSLLKGFGYRVSADASIFAAKDRLSLPDSAAPDLLLIDWKEPQAEIQALVSAVRHQNRRARFIMLTIGNESLREQQVSLLGADADARKPVTASSLFDAVTTAFGRRSDNTPALPTRFNGHRDDHLLGARVLLVEDNAFNQQIAQELLESAGLNVVIANNGLVAIDLARNRTFDAVLMDIQMPVMGGLEATRRLRGIPELAALPIIAMTAHAMVDEQHQCLEAGMNDFLSKPIEPEQLLKKLAFWIADSGTSRAARSQPAFVAPAAEETSLPLDLRGISVETGLHYCNDRVEFYVRMLKEFLRTKSDTGEQLRAALKAADRDAARRIAHTMKSVAGSIGAAELSRLAAEVERAIRDEQTDVLPKLLDRFDSGLGTVIAGLNAAFPAEREAPECSVEHTDFTTALQIAVKIEENLDSDVGEALALLPSLQKASGCGRAHDLCNRLATSLNAFDIESARMTLRELMTVLKTREGSA